MIRYRSASIAPGVNPPACTESEDASLPTLEDGGLRRCAASATEGEARFVGSWETEDTASPQEGQKRAPSETAAAQLGHGVKAAILAPEKEGCRAGRMWSTIAPRSAVMKAYSSFRQFYPEYLAEHRDPTCRRLHFTGSALVLFALGAAAAKPIGACCSLVGYGFAWAGHFFFEHNRPATFRYPLYSLAGDWTMFRDIITGRMKF
jgi:hypothetical protein